MSTVQYFQVNTSKPSKSVRLAPKTCKKPQPSLKEWMMESSPKLDDDFTEPAPTRSRRQLVKSVVDNRRPKTPERLSPKKTKVLTTAVRRPPSKFSSASSNDSPLSDQTVSANNKTTGKRVNTLTKKVAIIALDDSDQSSPETVVFVQKKKTRKIESSPESDDVFETKSSTRSRRK